MEEDIIEASANIVSTESQSLKVGDPVQTDRGPSHRRSLSYTNERVAALKKAGNYGKCASYRRLSRWSKPQLPVVVRRMMLGWAGPVRGFDLIRMVLWYGAVRKYMDVAL